MLINGTYIDEDNLVQLGSGTDICNLCVHSYVHDHNVTYQEAREILRGSLLYEPIFKTMIHGGYYTICKEHIDKIASVMDTYCKKRDKSIQEQQTVPVKEEELKPKIHRTRKKTQKEETENGETETLA